MRAVPALALSILTVGCATSTAGDRAGYAMNRITREEILGTEAPNRWEVVNRLRPRWLQVINDPGFGGEAQILVYRDNVQMGGVDALRGLSPEVATELRWLDEMEATSRFSRAMSSGRITGAISSPPRGPDLLIWLRHRMGPGSTHRRPCPTSDGSTLTLTPCPV
jgi:hypothetical protein